MKNLEDENVWWKTIRRAVIALLLVGALIGFCIWHNGYVSGTITIDAALLEELTAGRIEENWEKLLPLGLDVEYFYEGVRDPVLLSCQAPVSLQNWGIDLVHILIWSEHFTQETSNVVDAGYRRIGVFKGMSGHGIIGECESWMKIELPHCLIYMTDHEATGDAQNYEAALNAMIEALR